MPWSPKSEEQRLAELQARLTRTSALKLDQLHQAWRQKLQAYDRALARERHEKVRWEDEEREAERLRADLQVLEAEIAARRRGAPGLPPGS